MRAAQGARAVPGHRRPNLGQIQASRKVIAVPEQHTGAQLLIGAQGLIRCAERLDHRQFEALRCAARSPR